MGMCVYVQHNSSVIVLILWERLLFFAQEGSDGGGGGVGGDSPEGLNVRPCKPQWMSLNSQAPHEDAQPIKLTVRGPLTSHRD